MAGFWIVSPPEPMIEPFAVQEIPVDGPGGIFYDNGHLFVPWYRAERPMEEPHGQPQRVVKVKFTMAMNCLPETIGMFARCLWPHPTEHQPHPPSPSTVPKFRLVE